MPIFSSFTRLATEFRAARSRFLTEQAIGGLSPELRKDIGWPDAYQVRNGRYVVR